MTRKEIQKEGVITVQIGQGDVLELGKGRVQMERGWNLCYVCVYTTLPTAPKIISSLKIGILYNSS